MSICPRELGKVGDDWASAPSSVFHLTLHFDRLPGQLCRLLERLAGHYIEHWSLTWPAAHRGHGQRKARDLPALLGHAQHLQSIRAQVFGSEQVLNS